MNRLQAELGRLYLPPGLPATATDTSEPPQATADGLGRAAVLELGRPADWAALAVLWQGVQAELGLPAPAIAINGCDGYQLWFSFAQPLPQARRQAWLQALCTRYLPELSPPRLRLWPGASPQLPVVPAEQPGSGLWSAFVAPDLAAVFGDEPGIDLPPGPEAQADLLARLKPIGATEFEATWQPLQAPCAPAEPPAAQAGKPTGLAPHAPQGHTGPAPGLSPAAFLRAVMDDPGVALALRIEAARALLPLHPQG